MLWNVNAHASAARRLYLFVVLWRAHIVTMSLLSHSHVSLFLKYTHQEMIPARNARNVITLAEVMFVTIQRENILPSKITE
jgi:hypothetical protein